MRCKGAVVAIAAAPSTLLPGWISAPPCDYLNSLPHVSNYQATNTHRQWIMHHRLHSTPIGTEAKRDLRLRESQAPKWQEQPSVSMFSAHGA